MLLGVGCWGKQSHERRCDRKRPWPQLFFDRCQLAKYRLFAEDGRRCDPGLGARLLARAERPAMGDADGLSPGAADGRRRARERRMARRRHGRRRADRARARRAVFPGGRIAGGGYRSLGRSEFLCWRPITQFHGLRRTPRGVHDVAGRLRGLDPSPERLVDRRRPHRRNPHRHRLRRPGERDHPAALCGRCPARGAGQHRQRPGALRSDSLAPLDSIRRVCAATQADGGGSGFVRRAARFCSVRDAGTARQ